mmetsp:Transcript_4539/g.9074  ORF Transcript_4539/g.9074 Transcript_4539/m.9074 type:complete len:88 (-) Transcript_4539:688-951(-)
MKMTLNCSKVRAGFKKFHRQDFARRWKIFESIAPISKRLALQDCWTKLVIPVANHDQVLGFHSDRMKGSALKKNLVASLAPAVLSSS